MASLRQIPIVHFQVIFQGPLPDPALASGAAAHTLRDTMGPSEGPCFTLC